MRRSKSLVSIVLIVLIAGFFGIYFFMRSNLISSIPKERTLYVLFDGESYGFVIVDPERRLVKVFKAPSKLYDPESGLGLDASPREAILFFEKAFSVSFKEAYYLDLSKEGKEVFSKAFLKSPAGDLDSVLKSLLERGEKIFDVFTLGSASRRMRTFSNVDPPALYNLVRAFASFGYEEYEIKGMTKSPVRIEVLGKVLERIYLTRGEKERVKRELE